MKKKNKKKILTSLLSLLLAFSLHGDVNEEEIPNVDKNTNSDDDSFSITEYVTNTSYTLIEIAGQKGYLYTPIGKTEGLPLITYLSGKYETLEDTVNNCGIPYLLNNGYKPDYMVWIPIINANGQWSDVKNQEFLYNSIKLLQTTYELDSSRNIFIGYSGGAKGIYEFIANNPDFVSVAIPYSGVPTTTSNIGPTYDQKIIELAAKSDTSWILSVGDEDHAVAWQETEALKILNQNKMKASLKKINGATHEGIYISDNEFYDYTIFFNEEDIKKALTRKLGDELLPASNDVQVITKEDAVNASIIFKEKMRNEWLSKILG